MQTRAILFTAPNQAALENIEIPAPEAGEVLIESLYTLISPGTELRCRAGKQEGVVFPFIPGYTMVGRVIGRGAGVSLSEGTLVFCGGTSKASVNLAWGGHVAHAIQPAGGVYPLPEGMNPLHAPAAKLAAIAYRGVRLSNPRPHETVAVIGLGAIGLLAAQLHALSGARVVAADLSPYRVANAQKAGLEAFVPQGNLGEAFRQYLPHGADVVVDATGAPAVLAQAIEVAREKAWDDSSELGARVVIQGSYAGAFSLPYQAVFLKELSFYVPRDVQPRDIRAMLDVMARGKLNVETLISAVRAPESAPETYAALAQPDAEWITVAFNWQ
ncbi:MAG: zinc-binding alcohol dehydrogenase [Anaerolineales bacterium]|nr:zinc-binding alcohol dehydrogenase [Anaerolineales bacterium]MDW8279530.1 zinc-binding alcohol dehydrogenase [Anaerolineales bacterium]